MVTTHKSYGAESVPPSALSLSLHNCQPLYTYSRYSQFSRLFRCHCQHNCHSLYNRCTCTGCPFWLSQFQAHLGASYLRLSWLPERSSCTKILLMLCMQPTAIALNYSVKKNILNNICQIYMYEKSQLNH